VGPIRQPPEREGEGRGIQLGRGLGRGRGVWAKMAEKKEGGERKAFFLFIFQTKFSNFFPNEFFNSNSFVQNHSSHKRSAPACMQQKY